MQTWQVALIIDISTVLFTVLLIWLASKKGFIASFVELVGYVLSLILAGYFSSALSNFVYDKYLQTKITTALDSSIRDATTGLDWTDAVANAVKDLPGVVSDLISSVFTSLTNETQSFVYDNTFNIADGFISTTIKPMIISLLTSIFFVIIFTIILFLIKHTSKALSNVDDIPVLGTANRVLGGILGFAKSILIIFIIFMAMNLFIKLTDNQSEYINYDTMNKSLVYTFIDSINPLVL